jgi:hypothetical protein
VVSCECLQLFYAIEPNAMVFLATNCVQQYRSLSSHHSSGVCPPIETASFSRKASFLPSFPSCPTYTISSLSPATLTDTRKPSTRLSLGTFRRSTFDTSILSPALSASRWRAFASAALRCSLTFCCFRERGLVPSVKRRYGSSLGPDGLRSALLLTKGYYF